MILKIVLVALGVLLFCVIDVLLANEFYKAAVLKGYSEKKYYLYCLFLTFGGYLLINTLPDRGSKGNCGAIVCEDLPEV